MVSSSLPGHLALDVAQQAMEDAGAVLPSKRRLLRSVAAASLLPFFLLSLGHCVALSPLLINDYPSVTRVIYPTSEYGTIVWPTESAGGDAVIGTVMGTAASSFVLLCFSMVATVAASSAINWGKRLTPRESFSKTRELCGRSSAAQLYFTILFLGYLLSAVAALAAGLVAAGGALGLGTWHASSCLLAVFLCLYLGILRSVDGTAAATFVEEVGGAEMIVAPWRRALDLMDDGKLQAFFLFFMSLWAVHGLLVTFLWHSGADAFPPSSLLNGLWTVGTCGFFGYVGVLLQV